MYRERIAGERERRGVGGVDRKPQAPRSSTPCLASLSSLLLLPLLHPPTPRPITQCGNNNSQTPTPRASAAFSLSLALSPVPPRLGLENLKNPPVSLDQCVRLSLFCVNPLDKIVPVFKCDDGSCFLSPLRMAPTEVIQCSTVCVWICTVVMCIGRGVLLLYAAQALGGIGKGGLRGAYKCK